jgi:hypothetical protein
MITTLDSVLKYYELVLAIVAEAHQGQTRADKKTPYIVHPVEVERRVRARVHAMPYPEVVRIAAQYGITQFELLLVIMIVALGHDVKEDKPDFPLAERLLAIGIPANLVKIAMDSIDQLSNTTGGDYLDYILFLKANAGWIVLLVKEEDMNTNWDDIDGIPSKGRQKSMRTKYLLAHFILFDRKPYAALR